MIENNLPPAPSFFAWAGIEIQKGVQTGDAAEADARFAYESILKSLSVGTPSEPCPILKTKNAPRGRILTMAERESYFLEFPKVRESTLFLVSPGIYRGA